MNKEFWIPNLYEEYYISDLYSGDDRVRKIVFMNDRFDLQNYVNGNMFKDKRDAMLESRKIVIKLNNILSVKKNKKNIK